MRNQKGRDLEAMKSAIESEGEFRVHLIYSRGGTVTARMWHADGYKVGSAGGGGYDKQGAALAEAMTLFFGEELKALPLPVSRPNGSQSGLYGLGEGSDGKRYLDGACGLRCMLKVLEALGFTSVRDFSTGKDSTMILAEGRKVSK